MRNPKFDQEELNQLYAIVDTYRRKAGRTVRDVVTAFYGDRLIDSSKKRSVYYNHLDGYGNADSYIRLFLACCIPPSLLDEYMATARQFIGTSRRDNAIRGYIQSQPYPYLYSVIELNNLLEEAEHPKL